jgi:rare lipoprotein A
VYDKEKLTAAHPNLPLGTKAKVTNLKNDRSVVVDINDRGPFVKGRIVDLSMAAARWIGMIDSGVVRVRIEVLPAVK